MRLDMSVSAVRRGCSYSALTRSKCATLPIVDIVTAATSGIWDVIAVLSTGSVAIMQLLLLLSLQLIRRVEALLLEPLTGDHGT